MEKRSGHLGALAMAAAASVINARRTNQA